MANIETDAAKFGVEADGGRWRGAVVDGWVAAGDFVELLGDEAGDDGGADGGVVPVVVEETDGQRQE